MRQYPVPRMRRRRALFVHVPKNAGTAIASALYGSWIGHRTALLCRTLDPVFFSQSTRFAVLREPVDRFTSAYWFLRNGGGSEREVSKSFARSCRNISSLDDLISYVEARIGNVYDLGNVDRPQVWFLCDEKKNSLVEDFFVLGSDEARPGEFLRQRYGISRLIRLNETQKSDLAVTDQQRQRILAIYAADADSCGRYGSPRDRPRAAVRSSMRTRPVRDLRRSEPPLVLCRSNALRRHVRLQLVAHQIEELTRHRRRPIVWRERVLHTRQRRLEGALDGLCVELAGSLQHVGQSIGQHHSGDRDRPGLRQIVHLPLRPAAKCMRRRVWPIG